MIPRGEINFNWDEVQAMVNLVAVFYARHGRDMTDDELRALVPTIRELAVQPTMWLQ